MTFNNLCSSCINIGCEFQSGIVRTECAFYMPPHIESDNCGNYVVKQPTVETISKAEYENRVKADMVAILDKIGAKCDRINSLASVLPYTAHREIQELLCEIMDLFEPHESEG